MGVFSLKGKSVFVAGAEAGISRALAIRLARAGASITLAAHSKKRDQVEDVYALSEELSSMGGASLPLELDFKNESEVEEALKRAHDFFGGIDVLVNNSELNILSKASEVKLKDYDRIFEANARRALLCSRLAVEYLKSRDNPHIINISPPPDFSPESWSDHAIYTASKMLMSVWTVSLAQELRRYGIGVNSIWPAKTVANTALLNLLGDENPDDQLRNPEIMARAVHRIAELNAWDINGRFFLDEDLVPEFAEPQEDEEALSLYESADRP